MKHAAAYLRMSTDKQEYSIDSQLRLIKDYAERNGFHIERIYSDEGISGRQAEKRPSFMRMIEDSSAGKFNYVLIYDSSRFARNLEQAIVYKSELKRNGVELISITEPIIDEDTALITDALLGAMNEMYSRKLSKNVKRGMEQKALRGEYLSCAPYGYNRIIPNQPLQIDKKEAEIIKYIFKSFKTGSSAFKIAKELNAIGITTKRGHMIDKRWVQNIITNVAYKGFLKWTTDGKTICMKADHKPIIEEKEFDEIQKIYLNNKKKTKHKERPAELHKHWLSGILRCAKCGSVYVYAKSYGNNRSDRFRCGGYANGKCTISSTISVPNIENTVLSELKKILYKKEKNYILTPINEKQSNSKGIKKQINSLQKAILKAKEAYLAGIDEIEEYRQNKKNLINNINELKKKLISVPPPVLTSKENIKNISKILESNTDTLTKNKIIKNIIDKIILNGEKKEITIYFFS